MPLTYQNYSDIILKVSNDTDKAKAVILMVSSRVASENEVNEYIAKMRYALDNGAILNFQREREVDRNRPIQYTNAYTVADLFPDENPVIALRRELYALTVAEYLRTVTDSRYANRDEFWEFGRIYDKGDVYIKFRVTLLDPSVYGRHLAFVMSFHYAETPLSEEIFPYA